MPVKTGNVSWKKSYFAIIPVLNRRSKGKIERNVVKFIHKSTIFKSNPILKTLFIENVRICCIVMETSGKQSIKIICASAPYIFSLICKANPKLGNILNNEKVTQCMQILQEGDMEFLLTNVYHATLVLQKGVEKFYSSICVPLIKDSAFSSEKYFWYCYSLLQNIFSAIFKFFCDYTVPTFQYLSLQNRKLLSTVSEHFPQLLSACIKSSVVFALKMQKVMTICFYFMNNSIVYYNNNILLQNLHSFLKSLISVLYSSNVYTYLRKLFESLQPSMKEYFQNIFNRIKHVIKFSVPLIRNNLQYIFKEIIPFLYGFMENNKDNMVIVSNLLLNFISENMDIIKLFCNEAAYLFYRSAVYLLDFYQTILPYAIEFSSSAIFYLISCFSFILENCANAGRIVYAFLRSEYNEKMLRYFTKKVMTTLKIIWKFILNAHPYIVLFFRNLICRLLNLIPILSHVLVAFVSEINSSLFHASNEVVAKSCLAVKRISPSVWCTVKTVVPPTVKATHELVKSSTTSFIVIYPTVLKGILYMRPELTQGIIVLFSDGTKAWLEVASVSYSASCQITTVAVTISNNLPVVYKAMHEVMTTTIHAAVEVSSTSYRAKSRMMSDLKKAYEIVHSSVMLAENEVSTVYISVNSVLYTFQENIPECKKDFLRKLNGNRFVKVFIDYACPNDINGILNKAINTSNCVRKRFIFYLLEIFKILIHLNFFLISLICKNFIADESNVNSIMTYFSNWTSYICETLILMSINGVHHMSERIINYLVYVTDKIACKMCAIETRMWYIFKFYVQNMWYEICRLSLDFWVLLEHFLPKIWSVMVNHIPLMWKTLKDISPTMWDLICNLAVCIWRYVSSKSPVVWYSGRELVKLSWSVLLCSSDFVWQHTLSLSSEYWMLSRIYLPQVWIVSCNETRKSWQITCCLTESCWNFTMGTFFISWNLLHKSIAKSWKNGIIISRTAYTVCSTAGSVMKKTVCSCCKSKNYLYVILEAAPHVSDFSLNPLSVVKLPKFLKLSNSNLNNCSHPFSDNMIHQTTDKSSVTENIRRYTNTFLETFSNIDVGRIVNFEAFIPSGIINKYLMFS